MVGGERCYVRELRVLAWVIVEKGSWDTQSASQDIAYDYNNKTRSHLFVVSDQAIDPVVTVLELQSVDFVQRAI